jgi:hypothetical protein
VVVLATEQGDELAALADDLAPDAAVLQHEPSARPAVVIARSGGSEIDRPGVRAIRDVWRFDG